MSKRVNVRDAAAVIAKREEFKAASMRGVAGFEGFGILPRPFRVDSLLKAEYVVYSYSTPLAWVRNGRWHYADVAYGPTTGTHQAEVRSGMTGKPVIHTDTRYMGANSGRYFEGTAKTA